MLILFLKSQMGLFEMPVMIAGSVKKDGTVIKPHIGIRRKRIDAPAPVQADMFGHTEEEQAQKKRPAALDSLLRKYGGAAQVAVMLRGVSDDQRADALEKMAKIARVSVADMQAELDRAKLEDAPQRDLFAEPAPVVAASATPPPPTTDAAIIEYTTRKGKKLTGIVRMGITMEQAKEIDPYAFRLNGGMFIREKYLGQAAPAAAAERQGDGTLLLDGKRFRKTPSGWEVLSSVSLSTSESNTDIGNYWLPVKASAPQVKILDTTAPASAEKPADLPRVETESEPVASMEQVQPLNPLEFGVPAGTSKADRRRLNAAAADLVATKPVGEMDEHDRAILRQYSGNGGCGDSLNEFYTDPAIAKAIWDVAARLGYQSGTGLEPSCGTGVFLHTAPAGFKVTGIELDPTSADIATALHGDRHEIQNASLERFATQDMRQFNVVVGNPPYGPRGRLAKDDKIELSKAEQYFIDTSLDKTAPGGFCALVVPAGIMDSKNGRSFRERILRKAEFLGAQRMPNTAFEAAHTDVTADIIYFRKRPDDVAGALATVDQATLQSLKVWDPEFLSGGYFEGRGASNVFGTVGTAMRAFGEIYTVNGSMLGVSDEVAKFEPHAEGSTPQVTDILDALGDDEAAKNRALNGAKNRPYDTPAKVGDIRTVEGVTYVLQGNPPRWHRIDEALQSDAVTDAQVIAKRIDRVMVGDATVDLAELQSDVREWIKNHGIPAKNANLLVAAASDKSLYRLIGAVGKDGELSDVVAGRRAVAGTEGGFDTIARALALNHEQGSFTASELSERLGQDGEEVLDRLVADSSYAYIPDMAAGQAGGWAPMDVYLTGELWPKLDRVRALLSGGKVPDEIKEKFELQARRLEETIDPKSLEDVDFSLNSAFIPTSVLEAWLNSKVDAYKDEHKGAAYAQNMDYAKVTFADGVYSVVGGMWGNDLLDKYLNRTGVRKDDLPRLEELNQEFRDWLRASPLRDEIEDLYNRKFRGFVQRDFSNEPIDVPGLANHDKIKDYQWPGLRWALAAGKGIIAADVGLGKTLRGLLLARMAKIEGRAQKPTIVVPKSVLANWYAEAEKWFPGSKVLTIGATFETLPDGTLKGRDDNSNERKRKYHDLSQNDYDFVIISEPAFEELDLDPVTKNHYYSRDFWVQRGDSLGNAGDKRVKKIRENYEQAIAKREFSDRTDAIYFNQIGIDFLIADEMHHCFPPGTLVDGIPVELLKAGDVIKSFNHYTGAVEKRPVVDVAAMPANRLCRVTLSNGQSIVSTDNHRFFTLQAGYIEAQHLSDSFDVIIKARSTSKELYGSQDETEQGEAFGQKNAMHELRNYIHDEWRSALEGGHWSSDGVLLLPEVCGRVEEQQARSAGLATVDGNSEKAKRSVEGVQLAANPSGKGEEARGFEESNDESSGANGARREWSRANRSSEDVGGSAWLADGVDCSDENGEPRRVPDTLQDRHGERGSVDCGGSGRIESLSGNQQREGQAEDQVLKVARVVRVEILEPGGDGEFERLCPEGVVYDIEVAGNHNFFAEGILVHNSKNLYAAKNRFGESPKFLGGQGLSNRALDFNLKTRWLLAEHGNKGVYGLTATPTKNSPLEVYSMLCHIAPEAFENIGIRNSEEFLDRFCVFQNDTILNTRGEIEDALITAGFKNMNELREIMKRYIDRTTAEQVGLVLPKRDDHMHFVDMTPAQEEVYATYRDMLENDAKEKDATGDSHIFSIMDKMNKAALDLEILDPVVHKGAASPKYKSLAKHVAEGVKDGGQVVFSDYIDSHDKIVDALVASGIPRDKIGIINAQVAGSAVKRQNIADKFNAGKLRVVIGNTATMGEGINLQMGTADIHHLDLPWEPASMQQRNGRGLRQGNVQEAVRIHTYLSKGSFDGYRYQSIAAKKDWQDLLWSGGDRVDNLAREGKFSRQDIQIMMSSDPEAAREKFENDKAAAMALHESGERVKAAEVFVRFQELKAGYKGLKNKGTASAARLKQKMEDAKTSLKGNRFFSAKAALDSDVATVIQHQTGEPFHAGVAFHAVAADGTSEGKFVVTGVDVRGRTVSVRPYASTSGSGKKTVALEKLAHGVTKFDFDAEAEGREVAAEIQRAAAEKLNSIDSFDDVMKMPPAVLEAAHDSIQQQLKAGAKSYKVRFPNDKVPMIHRETGELKMAESYEHGRLGETHDYLLPTNANRQKVEQAWKDAERGAKFATGTLTTGRRNAQKYTTTAEKHYPGTSYDNKSKNPWSKLYTEMNGGSNAGYYDGSDTPQVRELRQRHESEQLMRVRRAPTFKEALAEALPLGTVSDKSAGYSAAVKLPKRALAMLWAKARHDGVLGDSIDDHEPKDEGNKYGKHSGYAVHTHKSYDVHTALLKMAQAGGYPDLAAAIAESGGRHHKDEKPFETLKMLTSGYGHSTPTLRAAMSAAERAGVVDTPVNSMRITDGILMHSPYVNSHDKTVRQVLEERIAINDQKEAA